MAKQNHAIVRRLKQKMAEKKINARELAERAAVGRSFVYDILSGKSSNPTSGKLAAIAEVLGVSVLYLMGEDAESNTVVFPEGAGAGEDQVISIASISIETTKSGNVLVTDEAEDRPYHFRKSWVEKQLKLKPEDLRIVFVSGDSMEPTLAAGDMMLIDVKRTKASPPGIFVLFDGEGFATKRLESISGGKMIKVMSDNKKYYSYDAKTESVDVVGRVVWFAREL